MSWQLIQRVFLELGADWIEFPDVLNGESAIKVTQDWSPASLQHFPGSASLVFCEVYGDGTRHNFRKLYPYREGRILLFSPPTPLVKAGLFVRSLAMKVSSRSRFTEAGWLASVYFWDGVVSELPGGVYDPEQLPPAVPVFDGGSYT